MRPLAAKSSTIEGTNPSLAIVDEYHLHTDNSVYSALELGQAHALKVYSLLLQQPEVTLFQPVNSIMIIALKSLKEMSRTTAYLY